MRPAASRQSQAAGALRGAVIGGVAGGAVGSIAADDRTYIQTHVYRQKVAPVTVKEQIVIGKPLPTTVKTYTFADRPSLKDYRYAYVNISICWLIRGEISSVLLSVRI